MIPTHPSHKTPLRPPCPLWVARASRRPRAVSPRRAPARCSAQGPSSGGGGSSSSGQGAGTTPGPVELSRRGLLLGMSVSVGGSYAWAARSAHAADGPSLSQQLEQRVQQFQLPNGLRFIVSERHAAPIVACHVYADVGAFQEEDGLTGIAHLLEHMAFKGTPRVGTRDFVQEAPLLDAMDEVFYSLRDARPGGREAARLQAQLTALQAQAAALSVPNEYGALLQRQGAVGLNATTSHDATKYYCSLPANKLELWFALEAERFQVPVFRELYSEKAVVTEERRLRVDNAPLGPFQEEFALASLTNNYRRPVIGFQQDIDRIGRREVREFFARHYCPSRLVVAIVGDVRAEQVRQLAEKYFGGWQPSSPAARGAAPAPASSAAAGASSTPGPAARGALAAGPPGDAASIWDGEAGQVLPRPAGGEWLLRRRARAGPAVMQAYYRPSAQSEDALALEVVSDVLSGSRSARLYKGLVLGGQALAATAVGTYPGEKYPGQFLVYGIPSKASSLEALDSQLSEQLAALAAEGPTPEELHRYKKNARTSLLNALVSNATLASALASYQVLSGDWRQVLRDLQRIEEMQAQHVREAAARLFCPQNLYRGYVLPDK